MTQTEQTDLLARIMEETKRAASVGYVLPVHVSLPVLLAVVGNLQLSLRHPRNRGHSAKLTRDVIEQIMSAMVRDGYPAHAELMLAGNDPEHDS